MPSNNEASDTNACKFIPYDLSRRPPFLLFLSHAESRILITLLAHVVPANVLTDFFLPTLSNFLAAGPDNVRLMLIKVSLKTSRLKKWHFSLRVDKVRRPLFGSGNKEGFNYSCIIFFRFGFLVTR